MAAGFAIMSRQNTEGKRHVSKANKDRRRAKRKKERDERRRRSGAGAGGHAEQITDQDVVRLLIAPIMGACHCGECPPEAPVDQIVELLMEDPSLGWRRTVDRALFLELEEAVGHVWTLGWQPAEFVRAVNRELGRSEADLVADMVVAQNRRHAAARVVWEWAEQVRELGEPWWGQDSEYASRFAERHGIDRRTVLEVTLGALQLMWGLPEMQVLLPPPGTARAAASAKASRVDPGKLAKVRALLAKAESTEFIEEAEAFTARAQQLMARHSIDYAALAAETGVASEVGGRRLPMDAPYEKQKALLLNVVAQTNRCRVVWHHKMGMSTVMGFAHDVNMVEMLFTSLLVQATSAMRRAGSTRDSKGRSTTRSFRSAFLAAFAERIGERLNESAHAEEAKVVEEYAGTGTDLVPVLSARTQEVDDAVAEAFPELEYGSFGGGSNLRGRLAGRAAADTATLSSGERIESG